METARDYETSFHGHNIFKVQQKSREFRDMAWSRGFMTYEHSSYNEDGEYQITITARKRDIMP